MKTFLILLAVGLTACDKLDRTYLPPPGAQYAGGNLGHLDVPLEPPHPGTDSGIRQEVLQDSFMIKGQPVSFGNKIPKAPPTYYPGKVPTTTTSYAFTQTTTFPPESYETTALPINPVTGLPVVFDQANNLPGFNQGHAVPTYGSNLQPGLVSQSPASETYSKSSYSQPIDQPLNQYPGRNVEVPGEIVQIPGPNKGPSRYPSGQIPNSGQQRLIPSAVNNQAQGQNMVTPGVAIQQYPDGQILGKPEFPSTTAPQNNNSRPGNDYGVNYPGIQNAYAYDQPTHVDNLGEPQLTQAYQHQKLMSVGGHEVVVGSAKVHEPGLTPTSSYPSRQHLITRPERPQAAADRNAVILNYENERTPNTYSYSYDTSNGIHADESGVVDNGTKAQGSYSYTGDDGKVYSVYYTADENGFQPRGDHLPTPPPIPEAIKRVIEQAARDKAAGIFDDGSYDEEKYGDKKYRNPESRRRPDLIDYKPFNEKQNGLIKPIAGINGAEDNQSIIQDLLPNTGTRKVPSKKTTTNEDMDVTIGNRRISVNNDNIPSVDKVGSNQFKEMSTKGNIARIPIIVTQSENRGSFNSPSSGSLRNKYSESKLKSNSPSDYSETDYDKTGENFRTDESPSEPIFKVDNVNNISTEKQSLSQKSKGNQPSISDYINNAENQPSSEVVTGYYYQQPNTTFGQTIFPTRFSTPATSITIRPDQRENESQNKKTLKPFITPNIYDQNNNNYQSTTRRPFTTVGVTSPADKSYTDYDDDDDYQLPDQDIHDDRIDSTRVPASQTDVTSRPHQSKQTLGPKYIPTGQSQDRKEILIPARKIDNSGTVSSGNLYGSTTPMPSHISRFGIIDAPRRMRPIQHRPIKPFSGSVPSDDTYATTERISGYPDPNIVHSHTTGVVPGIDSVSSIPGIPSTQNYPTSTYRPGNGYSSITGAPQSPVYEQGSGSEAISPYSSYTGYHYEPPKTDYSSDFFKPSETSEVTPSLPSGFNQNIYQQDSVSPSSTTLAPTTPRRSGAFILNQPGNSVPIGSYETNYENGRSTPNYSTTVAYSTPGSSPGFDYPGSSLEPNDHTLSGYVYRRPTPPFSTTVSPSTFGPTPTSYISSETPGVPNQGYSTTYRPAIQTTKATAVNGPLVDGFGRPIPSEGGTTYPGYPTFTQDVTRPPGQDSGFSGSEYDAGRPIDNVSGIPSGQRLVNDLVPGFNGSQILTAYPERIDHNRVTGEDFSGPKQPQRYDPKTGYHYK